nr:hypothetical protein [Tanacetum cinerariifolium]
MQTQTSNTLHNAIMEVGSKDRPPMLAPDKEVLISEGSPVTTIETYMENYKNVSQDIRDQLNVEVEAVQIILTGIDNDIYSTVDACPNACEIKFTSRDDESLESYYLRFYKMMNELVRNQCDVTNHQVNVRFLLQLQPEWQRFVTLVKQSQELKIVSYHKLYDILKQHQNEVNKLRAKRIARVANPLALVAQQQSVYHPQNHPTHYTKNSLTRSQQAATRNRGKAIVNSPSTIYDQEPSMVAEDDEIANQDNSPRLNKGTRYEHQRISNDGRAKETVGTTVVQKSRIQCYNCKKFGHVVRECQKLKRAKDAAYHREKMLLCKQEEAGIQLNADQADWRDDTDDESEDQELEVHYMYMAQIQEVSLDAADSGPIFDSEPVQKNDDDDDLSNERELLASLIEKLKCEIDDSKNRNKFLETSNKVLVEKLKGEIEDFKNKIKSLESSNNRFKEANNKLSKTNALMYKDLKKFQAELDRRNDVEYASKMEIDCAKAKGDLISYKMKSQKSINKYTQHINYLNQTISEMKKKLSAHQETISILLQAKEAQIKLSKTREDKELDKVIALENKVKESFNNQSTLLEKRIDESIPWDQKCKSSKELFKIKRSVGTIFDGVERCKETIAKRTYFGHIDPFIQNTIEANFCLEIQKINADLEKFHVCLKEEMVADMKYFNSLELEVDSLKSQLETPQTQFLNEIDRLSREYYYANHMNAILGVILTTSVSRPQLKSNPMEDRVMLNNSHGKKQEVEDHHRNVKFFKNKMSVTTCNDSLNAKTLNVNFVCATCCKCMLNAKHDMFVLKSLDGMNSRTKKPIVVPVSTREPKRTIEQSVAKPFRKTVASETTNQKPRNITRKLYERVKIVLFIVDSGCSKHMTGNLKLLINFVEKFLGTMKFGNDQIAPILSYGDLVQGAVVIKRVYYVEGLNDNLFSVGQFCDADLEVAFWKSTCYIRDLKGNDLLTGSHGTDLYSITLQDTNSPNPICLMNDIVIGLQKLKFVKDHLCSSCELGKAKRKSFQSKISPSSKRRLQLLHMDLCSPMRVASINGKKYVLVIVDDYSRYTWTHFLRSKDETPEVLIDFLRLVQRGLHAQVRIVRTDKGTESLNKTLLVYFSSGGILHQTSVARTHEQNGVVKRRNRTLVEAARTMLSAAKKPSVKFFYVFGSLCYIIRDGENLDKMKEKCDPCIFVGYSTQSRAYRVFNKRTRVIMETIHVNFDELRQMALDHVSSDPVPPYRTVTTSNELDLLFSLMFDELLNESSQVVSKYSAVTTADTPNHHQQQHTTPLYNQTTPEPTCQVPTQAPTVASSENINQAEMIVENAQVENDEFINSFVHLYKTEGRHRLVMLIRPICIHFINITLLNIVGRKIIR